MHAGVYQIDNTSEVEKPNMKQTLITSYNTLLAPRVKAACMETSMLLETMTCERKSSTNTCKTRVVSWCNQLSILLQRNLKERKHETFNVPKSFPSYHRSDACGIDVVALRFSRYSRSPRPPLLHFHFLGCFPFI